MIYLAAKWATRHTAAAAAAGGAQAQTAALQAVRHLDAHGANSHDPRDARHPLRQGQRAGRLTKARWGASRALCLCWMRLQRYANNAWHPRRPVR